MSDPIYHMICGLKNITEDVLFSDMMSCLILIETKIKTLNTEQLTYSLTHLTCSIFKEKMEGREMSLK